jgi:ADP-heptose:LPS heptosyltransferase
MQFAGNVFLVNGKNTLWGGNMRVDTMRQIDYYAGIPLCFIGTLYNKCKNFFFKRAKKPLKNVLLCELSEMGSTILVDPAMKKLRKETNVNLFFVIFKKNKASLNLLGTIPEKNIFTIREESLVSLIVDTLRFLFWARTNNIDTVIDLELFSRFTALITGFCGAQRVVGFHSFFNEGLYRGDFLTHKVAYNNYLHISKNFIALVNALIDNNGEIPYSKRAISDDEIILDKAVVTKEEKDAIREILKDHHSAYDKNWHHIILINPNASQLLIQRKWPYKHYSKLIKMILATNERILIYITGAPEEKLEAEALKSSVGSSRCINFAGGTTFSQLPALYSVCALLITNDSGPGHFSAVTDIKSYVFFGPETPALYGSLGNSTPLFAGLACSPCVSAANHRKTACLDNKCLQVMQPEYVMDIITSDLAQLPQ